MKKRGALRALASMTESEDGVKRTLAEEQENDKEHMFRAWSKNLGDRMGHYYSAHPKEWACLVRGVRQAEEEG